MKAAVCSYISALSLVVLLPFCGGGIDRGSIDDVGSDAVTYQTEDGVRIVAGWFVPPGETKFPVVILLHEQDGSRGQWNELIPILVHEGYAVLAPDLRGFGDSNIIIHDGQEEPYEFSNPKDAIKDVAAAIQWLKSRNDVDPSRTSVIGARLGADLAYVSTGTFPEVKAAVAMTPSRHTAEDPLLTSIPDFAAHDVCLMAGGEQQWEGAVSLGIRIQNPGGRRYVDHPDLDGVALLTIDDPIKDILGWLKERVLGGEDTPACTANSG